MTCHISKSIWSSVALSCLIALTALAIPVDASASEGALDSSFGQDGIARTNDQIAHTVAAQPDGAVVIADESKVTRLTADGSLGSGFSQEPLPERLTAGGADGFRGGEVAVAPDGGIMLSYQGDRNSTGFFDLYLVRYLPDGRFDQGFGDGGIVDTGFSNSLNGDLSIDALGRITVLTRSELLRFLPDGSPDVSFGTLGSQDLQLPEKAFPEGLERQADGKYVVVSQADAEIGTDLYLQRFMPDGGLDPTFGTTSPGLTVTASRFGVIALAVGEDGAIYFSAAVCFPRSGCEDVLIRFSPSGSFDRGFGEDGFAALPDRTTELLVDPVGRVLAATNARPEAGFPFTMAAVRYLPDGSVDRSFGMNGTVYAYASSDQLGFDSVAGTSDASFAPGGKLILAGTTLSGDRVTRILLERDTPDADLDGTRDRRDRCPVLPAKRRSGCPVVARELRIEQLGRTGAMGKLDAGATLCLKRQRVTLMKQEAGPDIRVASTETNREGSWSFERSLEPGRYYAFAPATFSHGRAYCRAARSGGADAGSTTTSRP